MVVCGYLIGRYPLHSVHSVALVGVALNTVYSTAMFNNDILRPHLVTCWRSWTLLEVTRELLPTPTNYFVRLQYQTLPHKPRVTHIQFVSGAAIDIKRNCNSRSRTKPLGTHAAEHAH